MTKTLKEIFRRARVEIPSITPYEVYKYWNSACDLLANNNFLQENENNLAVTADGVADLSTITNGVKKVLDLYDPKGYALESLGKNREYITKYANAGERRYAMVGETIYVKPPYWGTELGMVIVSDMLKFVNAGDKIEYQGDLDSFWEEHNFVAGVSFAITNTVSNNLGITITSIQDEVYDGSHTGTDDVKTLTDSAASFPVDGSLVGKTVYNYTARSYGIIISNTSDSIYAEMIGTYRSEWWMNGDRYEVIFREQSVLRNISANPIQDEAVGVMATLTPTSYIYKLSCHEGLPKFSSFATSTSISLNNHLLPTILFYVFYLAYKTLGQGEMAAKAYGDYEQSLAFVINVKKLIKEGQE
jgi:hypothetical protein